MGMLDVAIASIEAKEKNRAVAAEEFTRKQAILSELGPRLWAKFRAVLKSECEKRHQYFTFRVGQILCAEVVCRNRRALQMEYLAASQRIAFRIMAEDADDFIGTYRIGLDDNEVAAIFEAGGMILPSATYVAEELLTLLLSSS